jgi:hypothetical protein
MRVSGTAIVGVPIETDAKIIYPPDRYVDDRGVEMWNKVMRLLNLVERRKAAA